MTKEEVQARTQEKVKSIETLCKQLEITVSAEQAITPQGLIKQVVYYTDTQKYDVDVEKQPKKNEKEIPKPIDKAKA